MNASHVTVVDCGTCCGQGGRDVPVSRYGQPPEDRWVACDRCGGTGTVAFPEDEGSDEDAEKVHGI